MLTGVDIESFLAAGPPLSADDRADVSQLIAAYAACCDFAAVDALMDLFTEDAVWDGRDFRFPLCETPKQLRTHFDTVCVPGMRQVHSMQEPLLRQGDDADTAHGIIYFSAMQSDGGSVFAGAHAHGQYQDTYNRVDGRWLLHRRTLHLTLVRK